MENAMEGGHWCNTCSKLVNPRIDEGNKCPLCGTEFVEVMSSIREQNDDIDLRSAFLFYFYAPIFLGLMGAFSSYLPLSSTASQEHSSTSRDSNPSGEEEEVEQEHHLVLRRRRNTLTMIRFFRRLHIRIVSESENPEGESNRSIIVIDPFNEEAMVLRGPSILNQTRSSLGDFLVGPGFDLFLHHFAQNDPNTHVNVNPPAQKAAIEAMPSVAVEDHMQCTVCLEYLQIGNQVKEMPCKHKFHGECIFSWLKLHSSCPVCRFQIPSDDSIIETSFESRNEGNQYSHQARVREERMSLARRNWLPLLSPFDNFHPSP